MSRSLTGSRGPRKSAFKAKCVANFTLIELLVVIAIIAVLAALLSPALRSAKLNALDIKCGQNMRQIHMALIMYSDDRGSIYPPFDPNAQYMQLVWLSNIMKKLDFFRCPVANRDIFDPGWSNWYSTNIGGVQQWTEYKVCDNSNAIGKTVGAYQRPRNVVFVTDAIDWNPRHRGKNNFCFYDGHVELLPYSVYSGVEPGYVNVNWPNWGF